MINTILKEKEKSTTTFKQLENDIISYINIFTKGEYKVEFKKDVRYLGRCCYNIKTLRFNKVYIDYYLQKNDLDFIWNTVKHEVAHVLTKGDGHGKIWRTKCISLGGNGKTKTDVDMEVLVACSKYTYVCPNCGKVYYYMRKLKKNLACYDCCVKYNNGKYDNKYKICFDRMIR